ncbi:MAG: hypothetical protein COV91_03675 [Candidatus Taylorbacteria bacterium CG11_big_fil_rev_8_21_14_0_20_46_11]|uniref:DUF4134 domain-containing protein n=1 Tax=Candidatus Taylorbacteria bacterium CG11_big_fil_rev_8_21_14_0_20_46_11 TaxID=1975025 RepID=A0A2H0KBD9_9BACT|nr:MAG: hypothetical protein COV91_03675 [Candidatus Taylorbacteria bacterium CG11_big_fil_rev_8_21_14_0_20_46_11]
MKSIFSKLFTSFTVIGGVFAVSSSSVFATTYTPFRNVNPGLNFTIVSNKIADITNSIIPFMIGLAVAYMVWGIFKYVMSAGDTEKVEEGKKVMIYGIGAIFLMLSFWGLVLVIKTSIFG